MSPLRFDMKRVGTSYRHLSPLPLYLHLRQMKRFGHSEKIYFFRLNREQICAETNWWYGFRDAQRQACAEVANRFIRLYRLKIAWVDATELEASLMKRFAPNIRRGFVGEFFGLMEASPNKGCWPTCEHVYVPPDAWRRFTTWHFQTMDKRAFRLADLSMRTALTLMAQHKALLTKETKRWQRS